MIRLNFIVLCLMALTCLAFAQQIADTSYYPDIGNPTYSWNTGPVVFIDEGHHNFHTKDGRYTSFAQLLERDGYQVKSYSGFSRAKESVKVKSL